MRVSSSTLIRVSSFKYHFDASFKFHFDASSEDDKAEAGLNATFKFAKNSEFHFDEF